jgi:hypothetical protein
MRSQLWHAPSRRYLYRILDCDGGAYVATPRIRWHIRSTQAHSSVIAPSRVEGGQQQFLQFKRKETNNSKK